MLGEGWGRRAEKHVDILNTYLGGLSQIRGSMGIERKARDAKTRTREEEGRGHCDTEPLFCVKIKTEQEWRSE